MEHVDGDLDPVVQVENETTLSEGDAQATLTPVIGFVCIVAIPTCYLASMSADHALHSHEQNSRQTCILMQLILSIRPGHNIHGDAGQLPVPATLCYPLLNLMPRAIRWLAASHQLQNCLLSPHFLQTPRFLASINQ